MWYNKTTLIEGDFMKDQFDEQLKALMKLTVKFYKELDKACWKFIELYAHERAQGKRFDWKKLTEPQPTYYKIGIDQNLIQFLIDWSGYNPNE